MRGPRIGDQSSALARCFQGRVFSSQPAVLRGCNLVSPPPRPERPKIYFWPDSLLRATSKIFIAVMDREEPSGLEKTEVAPRKSS